MSFRPTFNLVACVIFCTASLAESEQSFFNGRWYTKPVYDSKLFACDVFTRIGIDENGTFLLRVFGIMEENNKKSTVIIMTIPGTFKFDSGVLKCSLDIPDQKASFTLKKVSAISVEYNDSGVPPSIYLNEANSPWTKLISKEDSNAAEQGAAANP